MKFVKLVPTIFLVILSACNTDNLVPPTPVSPIREDYQIHDTCVLFDWEYKYEVTSFYLQVASDSMFEEILFSDSSIENTSSLITIDSFIPDSPYYWRVCANIDDDWSDWAEESFIFKTYPIGVPNPISPIGSEFHRYSGGILFTWESADGPFKYNVQISKDSTFNSITYMDSTIEDLWHVISLDSFQLDMTHFWRIQASDWRGWGEWSKPVSFTYEELFDLDTTYFPFGLDYEWVYERHDYGFDSLSNWDNYDTVTIRVTDSTWANNALNITLDSGFVFFDNLVEISVVPEIVVRKYLGMNILTIPPETYYEREEYGDWLIYESFCISYLSDTLSIVSCDMNDYWSKTEADSLISNLLPGIGTISYRDCFTITEDSITHLEAINYKLISFSTPEGQIYP